MTRVALYARVSTEEQTREGVSIDAQLAALRTYAELKGWEIVREYVDAGYSGSTDQRPNFQQLLLGVRKGKFDIVTVAKLDRFFRNLRLLLNYLHELEQLGVNFIATQEGLDTSTPHGKFSVQILGVIAEFERTRIGERIAEGKRYRVSQGKWASGCTLYGYRWLPKEQEWQVVEEEAKVVLYVYQLYVNENLGSMKIPVRLNSEGYHTRKGAAWGFSAVNRILTHPAYKGEHYLGLKMPPIVEEATWNLAQRKRKEARNIRRNSRNWLLQGMGVCGLCGHSLSCIQKKPSKPRYYGCRGRVKDSHLDGSSCCQSPRIEAQWLEKAVWDKFAATISDSGILRQSVNDALVKLEERKKQMETESEPLDRQLEKVKGAIERYGMAFGDGAISEEQYRDKLSRLKSQEADLIARKATLDPEAQLEVARLEDYILSVRDLLDKGGLVVETDGIWAYVFNQAGGLVDAEYLGVGLDVEKIVEKATQRCVPQPAPKVGEDGMDCLDIEVDQWAFEHPAEARVRSMRAILQKFDTKVLAFADRIEVRGFIPTQVIAMSSKRQQLKGESNTYSDYLPK
jgi:site-specific DNA recombinase